jgi:hypothetical protein
MAGLPFSPRESQRKPFDLLNPESEGFAKQLDFCVPLRLCGEKVKSG